MILFWEFYEWRILTGVGELENGGLLSTMVCVSTNINMDMHCILGSLDLSGLS